MNVGWAGLGKLGLPCALVMADAGHTVTGFDPSSRPRMILDGEDPAPAEIGIGRLLETATVSLVPSIDELVDRADVIFVAVQTPHDPAYGGETPAPAERRDFEYAYLVQACRSICQAAERHRKLITMVIVSTVLPGTTGRVIRPLLNGHVRLVYSPAFIAMGTVIPDYQRPEFVLVGADDVADVGPVLEVFTKIHSSPILSMSIESAELAKVAYNVAVSMKIVLANTLMEICHKTGADSDDITTALQLATDRIISPRYLAGGMGDGGACHPRDLIALSWLAQRLGLSFDLAGTLASAREAQTLWLADMAASYAAQTGLPVRVIGQAYKPGIAMTDGSPALLLGHYLDSLGHKPLTWDPYTDARLSQAFKTGALEAAALNDPAVFVIATRHAEFPRLAFAPGSVVIDPFAYIPEQAGVTLISVGRK